MTRPIAPHTRFRSLEPTFCSGLLDDPVLYLHVRPQGRALLFDCGQIHHLAKRVMKSVDAVFITHCHMDHFMGIDTLIRHNHVSPRTIEIFGPAGTGARVAAKFSGYDWNLAEPCWCTFRVHEVHADRIASWDLPGPEGFVPRFTGEVARTDLVVHGNEFLRVEADICDHKLPALIFRVNERVPFAIDEERLEAAGLVKGDWLRALKRWRFTGETAETPVMVPYRRGERIVERPLDDPAALYAAIGRDLEPAGIGYITDVAFSPENVEKIVALMAGVSLLVCESSFLAADLDKARESCHLCTADLNHLLHLIRPAFCLPIHLSKSYIGRSQAVYDELVMPAGTTLIRLPERLTPRPFLPTELVNLWRVMRAVEAPLPVTFSEGSEFA
jgi:ribonuclease Z